MLVHDICGLNRTAGQPNCGHYHDHDAFEFALKTSPDRSSSYYIGAGQHNCVMRLKLRSNGKLTGYAVFLNDPLTHQLLTTGAAAALGQQQHDVSSARFFLDGGDEVLPDVLQTDDIVYVSFDGADFIQPTRQPCAPPSRFRLRRNGSSNGKVVRLASPLTMGALVTAACSEFGEVASPRVRLFLESGDEATMGTVEEDETLYISFDGADFIAMGQMDTRPTQSPAVRSPCALPSLPVLGGDLGTSSSGKLKIQIVTEQPVGHGEETRDHLWCGSPNHDKTADRLWSPLIKKTSLSPHRNQDRLCSPLKKGAEAKEKQCSEEQEDEEEHHKDGASTAQYQCENSITRAALSKVRSNVSDVETYMEGLLPSPQGNTPAEQTLDTEGDVHQGKLNAGRVKFKTGDCHPDDEDVKAYLEYRSVIDTKEESRAFAKMENDSIKVKEESRVFAKTGSDSIKEVVSDKQETAAGPVLTRGTGRRRSSVSSVGINRSMSGLEQTDNKYAAFISHMKTESAMEARFVQEWIEDKLEAPVFLNSDDLKDLSQLVKHVRNSAVLLLVQSKSCLTRPHCLVELITAIKYDVPIVGLSLTEVANAYLPTQAGHWLVDLDKNLLHTKDSAVQLLAEHGDTHTPIEPWCCPSGAAIGCQHRRVHPVVLFAFRSLDPLGRSVQSHGSLSLCFAVSRVLHSDNCYLLC